MSLLCHPVPCWYWSSTCQLLSIKHRHASLDGQRERRHVFLIFDVKKRLRKRKTLFWTVKIMNDCDLSCVTAMCCLRLKHFLFLVVVQTPESCLIPPFIHLLVQHSPMQRRHHCLHRLYHHYSLHTVLWSSCNCSSIDNGRALAEPEASVGGHLWLSICVTFLHSAEQDPPGNQDGGRPLP